MLPPFTITSNETNQRYDKFLRKFFKAYPMVTLKDIFARIRKGYIKVNGRKQAENYRVQLDDIVTFPKIPLTEAYKLTNNKQQAIKHIDLTQTKKQIIYQDHNRLAFNKPPGLVIHGGTKQDNKISLHDHLQQYVFATKNEPEPEPQAATGQHDLKNNVQGATNSPTFAPSFCYRLDKNTSGVIIAALTYPSLQLLNQLIRERQVSKKYFAIVAGKTPSSGTIDAPLFKGFDKKSGRSKSFINKEKGVHAITHYTNRQTISDKNLGEISLLEVSIETGRMHQIRIHLASIGHPVIGDLSYGQPVINRLANKHHKINRQLLHASQYSFYDSIQSKTISITADLPNDFNKLFT